MNNGYNAIDAGKHQKVGRQEKKFEILQFEFQTGLQIGPYRRKGPVIGA